MAAHRFKDDGPCLWCGVPMEKVRDRRAPPWCSEIPDEAAERQEPERRGNEHTGY